MCGNLLPPATPYFWTANVKQLCQVALGRRTQRSFGRKVDVGRKNIITKRLVVKKYRRR